MPLPTSDTIQTVGKYVIALAALIGCFYLIATAQPVDGHPPDMSQAWVTIGIIVGWIVRDAAGQSATVNAVKTIAAAQPTTAVLTVPDDVA